MAGEQITMRINTTDPLKAHSILGAQGWQLETMPPSAPRRAIGYYSRQDLQMFLLQRSDYFSLEAAPTSTMDSRLPQPGKYPDLPEHEKLNQLQAERNICTDDRVEQIDHKILAILIKHWR